MAGDLAFDLIAPIRREVARRAAGAAADE